MTHEEYRTYQINQPFVNCNDINKIDLTETQIDEILSSIIIQKLYPDIYEIYSKIK